MGIDLQILASHFRERDGELLATASLRLDRDVDLLGQLNAGASPCLVHALPAGFKVGHYEDDGLKFDEVDRHGNPLTYTTHDPGRPAAPAPVGRPGSLEPGYPGLPLGAAARPTPHPVLVLTATRIEVGSRTSRSHLWTSRPGQNSLQLQPE